MSELVNAVSRAKEAVLKQVSSPPYGWVILERPGAEVFLKPLWNAAEWLDAEVQFSSLASRAEKRYNSEVPEEE